MNIPFTNKQMSCLGKLILWVLVAIGAFFMVGLGIEMSGDVSQLAVLAITGVVLSFIVMWGKQKNKSAAEEQARYAARNKALNRIMGKYNAQVAQLKQDYKQQTEGMKDKEPVRKQFERLYLDNRKSCYNERDTFLKSWDKANATPLRNFWQWAIVVGFVTILFSCSFSFGLDTEGDSFTGSSLMESRTWSADNIPMPHMQDHRLYVSNPDSILSPVVVDSINATLGRLDDILGIESAMIIVGHIENDDPVGMVRGVYQRYKVGRNNRGLVIVVGYLDHSYFIAPGRNLEGDLTDAECNRLAQQYLIPSMRAEQPDSGMLYLARGVYSLMSNKDMPVMSSLTGSQDADDGDSAFMWFFAYLAALLGWAGFAHKMSGKVGWNLSKGVAVFMSNPFMPPVTTSRLSGRSHSSGGSWGGGGGHSGGYGGGSWGGGGSGGRW